MLILFQNVKFWGSTYTDLVNNAKLPYKWLDQLISHQMCMGVPLLHHPYKYYIISEFFVNIMCVCDTSFCFMVSLWLVMEDIFPMKLTSEVSLIEYLYCLLIFLLLYYLFASFHYIVLKLVFHLISIYM